MEKKTWSSTYPILCVFLLYLLSDFHSTHDHYKTSLVRDSNGEDASAAAAAIDLLKNVEAQAIIGPMFSEQASFLISLGNKSQVPIIIFSATSPSLASTRSPYFIRATTNYSSQVLNALGTSVNNFGWREVVPIYADNEFGEGIIPFLSDALGQVNARIRYRSVILPLATDNQTVAELYRLMTKQKRVFNVHMLSPLTSTFSEHKGIMARDYEWVITDGITDELSSTDPSAIESMLGIKGVKPYVPNTKELDDFTAQYKRRINPRGRAQDLDIFGLQAYDSALALAIAAEKANLGTPKYQEVNISRNYTDLDGFGISDAGIKLMQDVSSTTFKGLARNFNLVIDVQIQSPSYEIVKIVGPGARGIDCWTKENGTFKDLNFTYESFTRSGHIMVGDYNDLIYQLYRGSGDAAVGDTVVVERYRIDVFNAVMASLPIGYLVWVLEPQINKYFRHPFWHQLGMTLWFAFSAHVFSHNGITNELSSMDPSAIDSMLGVIGVKPYVPKTNELDDFRTRYKRRNNPRGNAQDLDIFGLWAYDAAMALAIAAENANLGNPKYQEANVSRDSTDIEGIGISNAGPKLIQALSSTTFKGLAGNFNLVDGQLQSPPYEIVNMVGPGARCIGYWTKENGIVKDLNFTSANTVAYSTSKSNLRLTIWPGDVSSSPRGWVIPTEKKTLRVGVPVRNGFTEFVEVTWNSNNTTKVEGYCIDIFDAVMSALPYGVAYEYIPFATKDHDMAGNYNDLIYQVYLRNYDAVAGDVTIVANRSKYVDFTIPYTESGIAMIVPVKEMRKNSWLVVEQLWFTIFCSFLFIVILERILQHQITKYFRQTFWYELGMILWFALSIIVFTHRKKVVKNLARLVLILWFLVVLILTQSYTASLSSKSTVQNLNPKVTDIDMLIKNKEYVGYMTGSFVFGLLKQMNIDESRLVEYDSPEELHELFSKGSKKGGIGAAFQEISYTKLFINKYCSQYTRVDPIYNANGFAFVLPIGSPLVSDVSRAILSVTESQQMVEIERKWLGDKSKCVDPVTEINLEVRSFWGLFAFVGGAGLMSLVICITLFLCHEEDRNRNLLPSFLNTILQFFFITWYPA